MPILEGDIKLLKSAVMADTSDGGGQMTGTAVVDGQSNNLFPDTSEIDRALGRVNLRKVFGVAHTTDTDTLLGAHAIITDAPDDPLVHCTLMKSVSWADTRTEAKDVIERYLVKGPRFTCRLLDTHYAGSITVRLYAPLGSTDFPAAGDAIVLRNVNGTEQYVRITKTSQTSQTYNVFEGSSSVSVTVLITTCDLGTPLLYDFIGAPVARAISNEVNLYASVYTTTAATGALFYGVKTLGTAAEVGDVSATVAGGIFTPLVPAATIETPIIDQIPYEGRGGVMATSQSAVSLPAVTSVVGPDTVLTAPTAIEPKSIVLVHGATTFSDDGGLLFQGTTQVGTVNYRTGVITFLSSAPNYGSASKTLTYKPASAVAASAFSSEFLVTTGNRGLAYTEVFSPAPTPNSFTLSYMAQGRWYVLRDNGAGKLEGSDSAYGVGQINYTTGSMAVTLGALPDVGSALIADWGDPDSAVKLTSGMPAKLTTALTLPAGTQNTSVTLAWSRGATNYTASVNASGAIIGDATGSIAGGTLYFQPNVLPDGDVEADYSIGATLSTAYSGSGTTQTLSNVPVAPGTARFTVSLSAAVNVPLASNSVTAYDGGNGTIYALIRSGHDIPGYSYSESPVAIGSINYSNGEVTFSNSVTVPLWYSEMATFTGSGFASYSYLKWTRGNRSVTLGVFALNSYYHGTPGPGSTTFTPSSWNMDAGETVLDSLRTSDVLFAVGDSLYSGQSGSLRKGWNIATAAPTENSAGTMTSDGIVTVTSLPSNGINTVTWYNIAQDTSGRLTTHGVFRTASAPLKAGVLQLLLGEQVGSGLENGTITGGGFTGTIDYSRGIIRWNRESTNPGDIRYNAVFLQYLPLDGSLLGLETARLPLDGKVPIFRSGGIVVVHNTQTYSLPDPLVKDTVYNLGRIRIAAVKVKTATGATVDTTLYTTDLDAGTITFPLASDLTGLTQPFTVDHRIEDVMLCSIADISGQLTFTRPLTHEFPANTSYVSSALVTGDVFARAYNSIEQSTWTGVWSDTLIGSAPTANYNETLNPIAVTNKGAITERWALIFTGTTAFRIVGQSVGEIGTGTTTADCGPVNPATGLPYFTISAAGWGAGWATGNVYRFNTEACGEPFWVVRTVLQGPATLQDDKFTLAFRGDVDRP